MAAVDAFLLPLVIRSQSPTYLHPLIFPLALLFRRTRKGIAAQTWMVETSKEELRRRRERAKDEQSTGQRNDLLSKLLLIEKERGAELDFEDADIIQEGVVAMFVCLPYPFDLWLSTYIPLVNVNPSAVGVYTRKS